MFLGLYHEILDAQCKAREDYKQGIDGPRTQGGPQEAMMQVGLKIREQHKSRLVKLLLVVDPSLGEDFFAQFKVY